VQDFLAEVSLLTDQDEHTDDTTPRVTLMTVHAAKGLEFPQVYVVGLEENLFPSQFCQSGAELEEERRLLYVAITRAMQRCTLTYARQRFRNGTVDFSSPSRFLNEIDRRYLSVEEHMPAPTAFRWQHSTWGDTPSAAPAPTAPSETLQTKMRPATGVTAAPAECAFSAGDRVEHRVFGKGTVERVYRENDNDKIDILFDGPGRKTLLLAYAKLNAC